MELEMYHVCICLANKTAAMEITRAYRYSLRRQKNKIMEQYHILVY